MLYNYTQKLNNLSLRMTQWSPLFLKTDMKTNPKQMTVCQIYSGGQQGCLFRICTNDQK